MGDAFKPRPVEGYQEQGAQAWLQGGAIEDDPHREGTAASAEWRLGFAKEALLAVGDGPWTDDALRYSDEEVHARAARGRALNAASRAVPSAEAAASAIGFPVSSWPMNCHAVATRIIATGLLAHMEAEFGRARACYGVYEGLIAPASPFAGRPFARHGWIEFESGVVVDPTRWVFTCSPPHLWVGSVEEYDLGANRLRGGGRKPPPAHDPADRQLRVTANDPGVAALLGGLLRDASRVAAEGTISRAQAFWLANLPPENIGERTPEVYRELERMGCGALIPVDNRDFALGPPSPGVR